MNLRDTIRQELKIAYDHGRVAGEGHWPGANREQVAHIGTERIEQAIQINRESSAANVAAREAALRNAVAAAARKETGDE